MKQDLIVVTYEIWLVSVILFFPSFQDSKKKKICFSSECFVLFIITVYNVHLIFLQQAVTGVNYAFYRTT